MKGQTYVMIIILAIVSLFALKTITYGFNQAQDVEVYDTFMNVKSGMINTVDLAILNDEDVAVKLKEFIDYTEVVLDSQGYDQSISFVISKLGNTVTVDIDMEIRYNDNFISDKFILSKRLIG